VAGRFSSLTESGILIRVPWRHSYVVVTAILYRNPFFNYDSWYPDDEEGRKKVNQLSKLKVVSDPSRGGRKRIIKLPIPSQSELQKISLLSHKFLGNAAIK
jgi:hypothetical protein